MPGNEKSPNWKIPNAQGAGPYLVRSIPELVQVVDNLDYISSSRRCIKDRIPRIASASSCVVPQFVLGS